MMRKKIAKVLQVIHSLSYGGIERLAKDIAYGIDKSRFETMILGLYGDGPLRAELESCDIKCKSLKKNGRIALEFVLYNLLKKEHVDVVHVHGAFGLTRVFIPARLAGAKLIYSEHALYSLQTKKRLRYYTRFATHFCHSITAVSNIVKQYLINSVHGPGSKIRVIYNGVKLNNFKCLSTQIDVPGLPSRSENSLLIGMVARLNEAKDHNTLLEAWRLTRQKGIYGKLVLIGDGELRISLEKKVRELGLSESVIFLGSRSDIPAILSRLDLCVLSSQREGFPLTILEYMAAERPFIATRVGAIPEIVVHKENGYLIPPKDPKALADAISLFCANPESWARFVDRARRTVEESYGIEKIIHDYEEIYEQALSN